MKFTASLAKAICKHYSEIPEGVPSNRTKHLKLNIKDLKYLLNKHFGEEWTVEEN
jgi:hypothetical protein